MEKKMTNETETGTTYWCLRLCRVGRLRDLGRLYERCRWVMPGFTGNMVQNTWFVSLANTPVFRIQKFGLKVSQGFWLSLGGVLWLSGLGVGFALALTSITANHKSHAFGLQSVDLEARNIRVAPAMALQSLWPKTRIRRVSNLEVQNSKLPMTLPSACVPESVFCLWIRCKYSTQKQKQWN